MPRSPWLAAAALFLLAAAPAPTVLPGEGRLCPLPGGDSFTYRFAEAPKLGVAVLKVQVFGPDGQRSTRLSLTGASAMPAMKGAHDSSERPFKLSRKGDYLLPVDVVMPGEWEVVATFLKAKRRIYRGVIRFQV